MAQEIYYTSAPEGLRPGDHGFCTVAATPGIPRRLLERLEALSGYRHHVEPRARSGRNPTCHAHWLLRLESREYHVLSRICDAGLDYTNRTNALAHHVVLETSELAAAGPAWLLSQPGLMIEQWQGHVGSIIRSIPLPQGDIPPAPCTRWQQALGEAGWAGVVAEALSTDSRRPICLLFDQDEPVLPLIAEVLALLPAASRWRATFNTYFTSLPGDVTCQWRCCIAGTPAAAAAVRYAATGLLIDLSQPHTLGPIPQSPWVTAARNGTLGPLSPSSPAVTLATSAKPVAPAPPKPTRITAPKPPASLTPQPYDLQTPQEIPAHPEELSATDVTASAPQPDISWVAERRKANQRLLLWLYGVACLTIAAGAYLAYWAYRSSSQRPLPPVPPRPVAPISLPTLPPPPATVAVTPRSVPTTIHLPQTPAPIVEVLKPAAPTPPPAPQTILLDAPLPAPGPGKAIGDIEQSVPIDAARFDDLANASSLTPRFPGNHPQWLFNAEGVNGSFILADDTTANTASFSLQWRDGGSAASPLPIVSVTLDKRPPKLSYRWSSSSMILRPEIASLAYWLLQNSPLVVDTPDHKRPQRIAFAPLRMPPTSLTDPAFDPAWPSELPFPEHLSLAASSPKGWVATSGPDAREVPPGRTSAIVVHTLRLEKPASGVASTAIPHFTLRFSSSGRILQCDLKQVVSDIEAKLAKTQSDSRQIQEEIQRENDLFTPETNALKGRLKQWQDQQFATRATTTPATTDGVPLTPEQLALQIEVVTKEVQERETALASALAPLQSRLKEYDARSLAYREALNAYSELKEVELVVSLPQGLPVGTLRLTRDRE